MQALTASNPDPKTMRQQRRAIMMEEQAKIDAILTPAQQQQYATLRAERRQHGEPGAQQVPATTPPPTN